MNIEITARHFTASEELRNYADEKVKKIYRYFDKPTSCHVILEEMNPDYLTEIKLTIPGSQFFVKDTAGEIKQSIDRAVDKLITQLKKYKDKRYSH
tara:strand:+ start:1062 stop:1349 length:288 start_codon:yes stop_codon:yes gene_type:complete